MGIASRVVGLIMLIVGILWLYADFTGTFLLRTNFGSFVDTAIGLALALIGFYILVKRQRPRY